MAEIVRNKIWWKSDE